MTLTKEPTEVQMTRMNGQPTVQLGDLVVAAFDTAAEYSPDPREVTRLATGAVVHMLRRARTIPQDLRRDDNGRQRNSLQQ
jgi:hypothetical protein